MTRAGLPGSALSMFVTVIYHGYTPAMIEFTANIEPWQGYALAAMCGAMIGLSKTGVPGFGILAIVVMTSVMDPKLSVGFILPILLIGDLCAVTYYRRHADWRQLLRLLPAALAGIVAGYFLMGRIESSSLRPTVGVIVLVLLVIDYATNRSGRKLVIPNHWAVATVVGMAAGIITMLANAAGPLIALYFLAMKFDKKKFMGTAAWYFFILNSIKVPFFIWQNPPLITLDSFKVDLCIIPAVAFGALAGIVILKRIPQKWFNIVVKLLVAAGAVRLVM